MKPMKDIPLNSLFPNTHWTRVLRLHGDAEEAEKAMEGICQDYWYPVYAFLRRSGHKGEDAEDLTQSFFHALIKEDALRRARPEGGKLRSFLLGVLMRTLSDHTRHNRTVKRGGGKEIFSLDGMTGEERYNHEPRDEQHPEALFSRVWAEELISHVRKGLREIFVETGKEGVFEMLLPYLMWDELPPPQNELAKQLGSTEMAAKVMIFRIRHKFRDMLQAEVAKTVSSPAEIKDELKWLQTVLAGQ
jgi:RNA polymerase sigma factor (sigma-70 family)